jgi:hypothetical protein
MNPLNTDTYPVKKANPNCKTCGGRGQIWYADSWDRDNGEKCWECFPTPVVSVKIDVVKDRIHSRITCGEGRGFKEVLEGLKLCVKELQEQIKNRKKCPMHKK